MKLFMMLIMFMFLSITVLGENPKNRNLKFSILSADVIKSTIETHPAIIANFTHPIINISNSGEKEKPEGLMLVITSNQISVRGAEYRILITHSIMEFKNDFNARGPLKKVLKKPINRDYPA